MCEPPYDTEQFDEHRSALLCLFRSENTDIVVAVVSAVLP